MLNDTIRQMNEYLEKIKTIDSRERLKTVNAEYAALFCEESGDRDMDFLKAKLYAMISELVILREERRKKTVRNSTDLSETEHSEIFLVQKLIDYNLFVYHFQPIVRTDTGEIYSYEALRRAKDMQGITPFHILKYAELTDRLSEVEQYTFLNVLSYVEEHKDLFDGKFVFINSMPNVHIDPSKESEISHLLGLLSDKVVVEMTENSEYDDAELSGIKEKYKGLNIRIAIDDYGTGYSNISNLLRYTPNYVKIDRSLLSGIQNNPNKKHFVREIIDFCHDNNILALAEGVENSEELRTVILLGADLVQGFYIARPSAVVLPSLPYELKMEIRSHRQEREDGKRLKIYTAQSGERVSLDKLKKEDYSVILIGAGTHDGNVTVSGSPYLDTGIHIETAEYFCGKIILDQVRISSLPERPCIDIGENNEITLLLIGNNVLENSGVRVPKSSKLTVEGKGGLDIKLGGADYYGIGNDLESEHGDIVFSQDGTISISSDSHSGVCIGSGRGGRIKAERGRYVLRSAGSMSVCIGAFDGDADIELVGCDIDAKSSGAHCSVIGSLNGSAEISAVYSSLRCKAGSIKAAVFGTVMGKKVIVRIRSVNISVEMNADTATAFGALECDSDISIDCSSLSIKGDGKRMLAFGSIEGETNVTLTNIDMSAEFGSELNVCCFAQKENVHVNGGRYRINLNGSTLDNIISL